jgi:hypothetical protein
MKDPKVMTDHEWAEAFIGCQLPDMGHRFADTVRVLEEKLAAVRAEPGVCCDPEIGQ